MFQMRVNLHWINDDFKKFPPGCQEVLILMLKKTKQNLICPIMKLMNSKSDCLVSLQSVHYLSMSF